MALMLQGVSVPATLPGWVPPTVAVALVVIALGFVVQSVAIALAALQLRRATRTFEDRLEPVMSSLQKIAGEGEAVAGRLRGEAEHVIRTSRRLRGRVEEAAEEAEERMADLAALYDVAYGEVEDTVMALSGSLRTGRSVVGTARSFLGRRKRRKRRRRLA